MPGEGVGEIYGRRGVCSLVFAELLEECGNGVRRYFTAWLGSRGENGAGKARLCLRGREETCPHAAELGGVLGRGLGEEGGGGRVRRRLGVDLMEDDDGSKRTRSEFPSSQTYSSTRPVRRTVSGWGSVAGAFWTNGATTLEN